MGRDTSTLEPGEDSIGRVKPRQVRGAWVIDWRIKLLDGSVMDKRTQAKTVGEARRRARETAKELLQTGHGWWRTSSSMTDYVDKVSVPAMESAKLAENSRARYRIVMPLLVGRCSQHRHQRSLAGKTIAQATTFAALADCLAEISELHGAATVKQARTVLNKYVLGKLMYDGVITRNPIRMESLDLPDKPEPKAKRGGRSLTREEYQRVLRYLLDLDPAEGVEAPARGRWSFDDAVSVRRNLVDLTLLQVGTGLRVSEANGLTWDDLTVDHGITIATVRVENSKTGKGRKVALLNGEVAERIWARRRPGMTAETFVIGSPTNPAVVWNRDNCRKRCQEFYRELGATLDVPLLEDHRTHVWRTTLNSQMAGELPLEQRSAYFGHDPDTNAQSYTATDPQQIFAAAQRSLFVATDKTTDSPRESSGHSGNPAES